MSPDVIRECKKHGVGPHSVLRKQCRECQRGYSAKYRASPKGKANLASPERKAYQVKWRGSPKGKASQAKYRASPEGKASNAKAYAKWCASPEGKATLSSPERKAFQAAWRASPKGKEFYKKWHSSLEGKASEAKSRAKYRASVKAADQRYCDQVNAAMRAPDIAPGP